MKKLLEIKGLTVEGNNTFLLNEIDLCFYESVHTFLCGTSASGKTLLLKAIAGMVKYKGEINASEKVEVVFDKAIFLTNTVEDELKYVTLEEEQKKIIHTFLNKKILKQNPNELDLSTKKLLLICNALVKKPVLLFIDHLFSYLEEETIHKVFQYLEKNHITLVHVSTNIENVYRYPYMIVLNQGQVAIEGKTMEVLKEEKLLKRLGIGLPFFVDLSIQLKLYGLLDKIYSTKEELVSALWK